MALGRDASPVARRASALALGLVIVLIGGLGVEASIRALRPDPLRFAMARAEDRGTPFDPRSRMERVADLRAAGTEAVPRIVPAGLLAGGDAGPLHSVLIDEGRELLPLAGISHRTTVLCNELGSYALYESDRHGFRNPPGLWDSGESDLVLVGDSFTLGECVPPGATIAARLRARWPATLNLGYSGNSPLLELATLAEYGPALAPRTTLWIYFENDLSEFDLARSVRSPLLLRYLEPGYSQSLVARQEAIDARLAGLVGTGRGQPDDAGPVAVRTAADAAHAESWERLTRVLVLERTRKVLSRILRPESRPRPEPIVDDFEAVLRRARALTGSWGGELVFVYLPGAWNFDSHAGVPRWAGRRTREQVLGRVRAVGLPIIDVEARFATHPDPLSLYSYRGESELGSPHMGPAGYRAVAAEIEGFLESQAQERRRLAPTDRELRDAGGRARRPEEPGSGKTT